MHDLPLSEPAAMYPFNHELAYRIFGVAIIRPKRNKLARVAEWGQEGFVTVITADALIDGVVDRGSLLTASGLVTHVLHRVHIHWAMEGRLLLSW